MNEKYDVVIAGGGPAGSTAAIVLARAGMRVCVLEKDRHPRFHIGESILPRTSPLLRELGIADRILKLTHVTKYGAEFGMGDDHKTRKFTFNNALIKGEPVFNIERALFDKELLDIAREAGAEVFEGTPVRSITKLAAGDVEVEVDGRTVRGRVLLDASGHGTVVGRKLDQRRGFDDPQLQKVAYFEHFENVERAPGDETGHPCIIMCDEGWFWLIGLSDTKTSVGFVTRPSFVRTLGVPPKEILAWAIARCPVVAHRMRNASGPRENIVLSDFSYRCRPYAGPGFFLVGDAACFLDPIFSTGVTLAMMSGNQVGGLVTKMLRGQIAAVDAQREHIAFVERTTKPFWRLIKNYYRHSFRELFMNGGGPLQMPGAIISVLAGQVFPKAPWSLRWRHRAFDFCVWLQQYVALSPRRPVFKLVTQAPQPPAFLRTEAGHGRPVLIGATVALPVGATVESLVGAGV